MNDDVKKHVIAAGVTLAIVGTVAALFFGLI